MAMNRRQWDAVDHAFDPYDDSERVAERLREYTYAELRAEVDHYHAVCQARKGRPFGFRFGEYLRDQISRELAQEDRQSDAGCHEERSYYDY